jgi:hypothetical protein
MAKKVFASADMLHAIDPTLLLRLLMLDTETQKQWAYKLPLGLARNEELNCEAIAYELKTHGIPDSVAEVLAMVQALGGQAGWTLIKQRAHRDLYPLDIDNQLTPIDNIVKMMLDGGAEANRFLVRVASLAQAKQRVSYTMFPQRKGFKGAANKLDDSGQETLRKDIAEQLFRKKIIAEDQRPAVRIYCWDMGQESMYIVRYPGQLSRTMGWDQKKVWKNFVFNPARYDTVIYDSVNNAIKTNVKQNSTTIQSIYRMTFAQALFQTEGVWVEDRQVVGMGDIGRKHLDDIFHAGGVNGLRSIKLVSVKCTESGDTPVECNYKVGPKGNLVKTDKAKYFEPNSMVNECRTVQKFTVRFKLERANYEGFLTVECGNAVSYPRDIESAVLEHWLRERNFIKKEGTESRPADFWARSGQAALREGECLETWHVLFGSCFDIAKKYLVSTEELAKEYPHPKGGLPLQIEEREEGIYAVCEENAENYMWCKPKKLSLDESLAYKFDFNKTCKELCDRCGIQGASQQEGDLWRLGMCEQKLVYGYFGSVEDSLKPLLSIVGNDNIGCIFVPSLTDGMLQIENSIASAFVPVCKHFTFEEGNIVGSCNKPCLKTKKDISHEEILSRLEPRIKAISDAQSELQEENVRLKEIATHLGAGFLKFLEKARIEMEANEFDLFTLLLIKGPNGDYLTQPEIGKKLRTPVTKQAVNKQIDKFKEKHKQIWDYVETVRNTTPPELFSEMGPTRRKQNGIELSYGYRD